MFIKKIIIFTTISICLIVFYELFSTKNNIIYEVRSGFGIDKIANDLKQKNIINSKSLFTTIAKIKNISPKIGYYKFNNLWNFLDKIQNYKVESDNITLLPGKTIKQYYKIISNNNNIKTKLPLRKIMQKLKIPHPFEGRFLPQTYKFNYGDSAQSIFARSYNLMNAKLSSIWSSRVKNKFIVSKYQLLILASIIEKESGDYKEGSKIAGVFINRLQKNMRLQTDPTVIYALGDDYNGILTKKI